MSFEKNYRFAWWCPGLVLVVSLAGGVHAQGYPQRAVRVVVPNAPGGGSDTVARVLAERLTSGLRQPVIVENRAGAGGRQAAEFVAKAQNGVP